MLDSTVKVDRKPTRCPYCHDDVMSGLLIACSCGAVYHKDCADDLTQCASCPETAIFAGARSLFVTPKVIEQLIQKITSFDTSWEEVYDIAKGNSKSKLWLVGGKVYRTLAEILYKSEVGASKCDYDFITAQTTWFNHIPGKWYVTINDEYGETRLNPYMSTRLEHAWRYWKGGRQVLDLMTFNRATQAGQPANLDGYFWSVPLDVQAIALDIEGRQLVGPGIEAVTKRTVGINNPKQAADAAKRAGLSLDLFVEARAHSLGFTVRKSLSKVVINYDGQK
jgi:hypothetical protein